MRIKRNDIIALSLVCAGLLVIGFMTDREPAASPDTYSTHDARGGGYLAWYRLLRMSGMRVERLERPASALDGSIATLVAANNGRFSVADVAPLARFVRDGGRLIWISAGVDERDRAWKPLAFPRFRKGSGAIDAARPLVPSVVTRGVHAVYGDGSARIVPGAFPPDVPVLGDRTGAVLVRYALGRGRVVIVTDPSLFTNRNLARAGNARLALSIVTSGRAGSVAFDEAIHGYVADRSIWSVFPGPLRAAVIGVVVVAALALYGAAIRTTPLLPPEREREPSTASYLASVANLLRRGNAARRVAAELADSTYAAAARTLGLAGLADERVLVAAYRLRGDEDSAETVRRIARICSSERISDAALVELAEYCFALRKKGSDGSERSGRTGAR